MEIAMKEPNQELDEILNRLFLLLKRYRTAETSGSFIEYKSPADLTEILDLNRSSTTSDWEAVFDWLQKYLNYTPKTNHPDFLNRMWCGANLPSILAEITTAFSNTSAGTYESAPVATLMEKQMIQEILDLLGFENGAGQMTTGSSNANMIAMLTARNNHNQLLKQQGLFNQKKIFAIVSAEAHYSMDMAANVLGLGTDNLLKIPVTATGEMDLEILSNTLEQINSLGGEIFFLGATAGTTVRGAFDPIPALLELRKRYNFWLHVDGAWGGAVVLSPRLKKRFLSGVQDVDSITWDFHKMVGTAMICNILLVNRPPQIFNEISGAAGTSYLFNHESEELYDLGILSLQCGKRVDALKWFLDWRFYGRDALGNKIEQLLDLCQYAEELISESKELEMVIPRQSFNICFRFRQEAANQDQFNSNLRRKLYESGQALIGLSTIDGKKVLRLLFTNKEIGKKEVKNLIAKIINCGKNLTGH